MRKIQLSSNSEDFIRSNWYKMPMSQIAAHLGIAVSTVRCFINRHAKEAHGAPNSVCETCVYPISYAKHRVEDMLARLQALKTRDVRIYNEIEYMRKWLQRVSELPVIEQGDGC